MPPQVLLGFFIAFESHRLVANETDIKFAVPVAPQGVNHSRFLAHLDAPRTNSGGREAQSLA